MQTYTITKAGAVGSACPDDTQISMTGKPQPAAKPMPTEREMDAAMTAGDIPF